MTSPDFQIVPYSDPDHRQDVVALWNAVFGYDTPHNEPGLAIDRKLAVDDGLFFVAVSDDRAIGTALGGYDGHRGWIYSLAVDPAFQRQGIGTALLRHVESALVDLDCVKINLQIAQGNEAVESFYAGLGYATEERVSMGKRLVR